MVKRRRYLALTGLLVTMVLAVGIVVCGYMNQNYVRLNGVLYDRYAQSLDLSGVTGLEVGKLTRFYDLKEADLRDTGLSVADFEKLQKAMPECKILWQVPFQGQYLDQETTSLKITHLTMEEAEALRYLPRLRQVDAEGCGDLEALLQLKQEKKGLLIDYLVELGGTSWAQDTTRLVLPTRNAEELKKKLQYLPKVREIVFTGEAPALPDILELEKQASGLTLFWRVGETDVPIGSRYDEMTFRQDITQTQARQLLKLLPNAEKVPLRFSGMDPEEIMGLCEEFPDRFFLWDVPFGDRSFPSDAEEIDLSGLYLEDVRWVEERIAYMPNLKKVMMCDCGVSDEDMDALDRRHEDIRFIWTVYIGRIPVRTDAVFFAPVTVGAHVYEHEMEPLQYCHDLIAIDLGHMAIRSCTWAEQMPHLQYLIIADTGITDISPLAGCKELIFLEMFITAVRDYSPLLECKSLEDLNLCYTYGSAEPVKQMTWLKRLWWDGNPYETKGLDTYLPDTDCNFHSGSSTGGTWRQGQRYKEQRDIIGMPYLVG